MAEIEEWEKQGGWKGSRRKKMLLEQGDGEEGLKTAPPEAEAEIDGGPVVRPLVDGRRECAMKRDRWYENEC